MGEPEDPAVQGADKAFESPPRDDQKASPTGERQEDRVGPGVRSDDDPEDVGESTRRSGEDIAASGDEEGRTTEGTKGPSDRPYGTSDAEDSSGVNPQGSVTEGPDLPAP